jgi:hypothetical protein
LLLWSYLPDMRFLLCSSKPEFDCYVNTPWESRKPVICWINLLKRIRS